MQINFVPSDNLVRDTVPKPCPSSLTLPAWYTSLPTQTTVTTQGVLDGHVQPNKTVKRCMPFLDALTFGYTQLSWCEMRFSKYNDEMNYEWSDSPVPFMARDNTQSMMPIPDDYEQIEFAWLQSWYAIAPKGYSLLITHPLNRHDLPFTCTSGVVDNTGDMFVPFGRIPFFIKKGFTGVIPVGTPLYQIIPFKTDNWQSEQTIIPESRLTYLSHRVTSRFGGWYRDNLWTRKRFK